MKKHTLADVAEKVQNLSPKETEKFFQAFFTPGEIETLVQRVNLVDLLVQKKPQREIIEDLGISFSQVSRGSHELKYGTGKAFFPKFYKS